MNKETIQPPYLNKKNEKLLNFLKKKGVFIKWFKTDTLKGEAWAKINGRYAEIVFRDKEPVTQYKISHELLHIFLFVKGYPKIRCKEEYQEYDDAITTLNDIFAHIIMTPFLNTIKEEECPAIERGISGLEKQIERAPCELYRKMFLNFTYVRAKTMSVDSVKLKQLETYLKVNNLYNEKIIKSIIDNLPKPNCKIKDYKDRLERCVEVLGLNDIVEFDYFGDKEWTNLIKIRSSRHFT